MLSLVADFQQGKPLVLNPKFVQGLRSILSDSNLDKVWPVFFFLIFLLLFVGREEVEDSCTRVDRRCNGLMRLNLFVIQEFVAKAITLPGEGEIMDMMEVADPDAVHAVRSFIRKQLASELKAEFLRTVWPVTLGLLYLYLMSPHLD